MEELDLTTMTRNDVVPYYVDFIIYDRDVAQINKRIIERWSNSGLLYIKNKAWKKVDELSNKLSKQ